MKKFRIILYQKPLGIPIPHRDIAEMKEYSPHFICFPEYFFVSTRLGNHAQTEHTQNLQLRRIELLSRELKTVVIGGTMPELSGDSLYNTSFVFDNGELLGSYRKKHLFFAEVGKITPGDDYRVFTAYDINIGVLICADVFHDSAFLFMKKNNVKIIFSPTFSLYKNESVEEKYTRDKDIYMRGSALSGSIIVKVCGVKSEYKNFLQARSLISEKDRIIYRVKPDEEDKAMIIKQEIILQE